MHDELIIEAAEKTRIEPKRYSKMKLQVQKKVNAIEILRLRQVFLMENFMGLFFRIAMFQNGLKVLHIPCQSNLIRSWKQEQIK